MTLLLIIVGFLLAGTVLDEFRKDAKEMSYDIAVKA